MHETFEELASRHIDGLYHGALFLNAGEEPPAEDLVLWTLTGAFQEFRQVGEEGGEQRWLEGRLVRVFLARGGSSSTYDGSTDDRSTDALSGEDLSKDDATDFPLASLEIDPDALFGSAANMPPLARAAIWLVLFRRWSYDAAASALDADVDGLKELLRYRHTLLTALVPRSADRNGTDHDRRH